MMMMKEPEYKEFANGTNAVMQPLQKEYDARMLHKSLGSSSSESKPKKPKRDLRTERQG